MAPVVFKECLTCASKSGSPALCAPCVSNRDIINHLVGALSALRSALVEEQDLRKATMNLLFLMENIK